MFKQVQERLKCKRGNHPHRTYSQGITPPKLFLDMVPGRSADTFATRVAWMFSWTMKKSPWAVLRHRIVAFSRPLVKVK